MKKLLNCPNCGAPVEAEKCAYCGTVFLDFAAIQIGAPTYVKFKLGDTYICARLVVESLEITPETHQVEYVATTGERLLSRITGYGASLHLDAHAVCSPGESFVTIIQEG